MERAAKDVGIFGRPKIWEGGFSVSLMINRGAALIQSFTPLLSYLLETLF